MPTNPELKEMTFEGKAFFRVGCRNCGGGDWLVFTDGKGQFIGYCFCGHKIDICKAELTDKPDEKPIPLRMVI